jgi:hypothetical protein
VIAFFVQVDPPFSWGSCYEDLIFGQIHSGNRLEHLWTVMDGNSFIDRQKLGT